MGNPIEINSKEAEDEAKETGQRCEAVDDGRREGIRSAVAQFPPEEQGEEQD